jgi:hypothetical protein
MAKFLRFSLLLLVVTALVWVTSTWRWHVGGTDPGAAELMAHLVALPLALTGVSALAIWQVQKLRAFAASPLAVPSPAPAVASPQAPASPAPVPPMQVLATDVQSRIGDAWDPARQNTLAGDHLPRLHARFVTGQGHPAFVAEWADLDADEVAEAWEAFVAEQVEAHNGTGEPNDANDAGTVPWRTLGHPPDDVLRVLALLGRSLAAMTPQVREQWPVLAVAPRDAARGAGAPLRPPRARIDIALPARWSPPWHAAVSAWLQRQLQFLVAEGLNAAGQSAAMAQTPQAAVQLRIDAVDDVAAFWSALQARQQGWLERGVPGLMLVIAADSGLSQAHVSRMDTQRSLLTLQQPQGRLPGEAAAALLLATPGWLTSPAFPPAPPLACLGPLLVSTRATHGAAPLGQAIDLLQLAGVDPSSVGSLTTDTDQRVSQQAELLALLADRFPHLASSDQVLCVGVGCGDAGIAQWPLCVALGVDRVARAGESTLVVGHGDPPRQLTLLLKPVQAEPDDQITEPR